MTLTHKKNEEGHTEFFLNGEQIDADEVCMAFNNSSETPNDDRERLYRFAAKMGIALRDDYNDLANEAWRALPDHLQNKINEYEEKYDSESREEFLEIPDFLRPSTAQRVEGVTHEQPN